MKMKFFLVLICAACLSQCTALGFPPNPDEYRQTSPYEYFLYVPSNYSTAKYWPVFVFIHGEGGSGRDCWNTFQGYAEKEGYILVCPSIADASGGWYQRDGEAKLLSVLGRVYAKYHVMTQIFLAGFSAGGQFVQGFAFTYPGNVAGVSVIAPGNVYSPTVGASSKPFYIMAGDRDDPILVENAKILADTMARTGYRVKFFLIPGIGHQINDQEIGLTLELYRSLFKQAG